MEKKNIPLACLFMIAGVFFVSCQKQDRVELNQNLATEAKNWFTNSILAEESRILAKSFAELTKTDPVRVLARMNKLSKNLNWSHPKVSKVKGLEYVIVPLERKEPKLRSNYYMKRVFVFYKENGGPIQLQIIELLTKTQITSSVVKMASMLFERKLLAKHLPAQIQDVNVFFYDKQYHTLDAYKVSGGQWQPLQASSVNRNGVQQGAISNRAEGDCQQWGLFLVTYDGQGNEIDRELLYTYWVGDCGGENGPPGDHPNEELPEPEGGGSEYEIEAFKTLTWHVYNTNGGQPLPIGIGSGVHSQENVRGVRVATHPNGGYFKSASHHTSTCNSCDDPANPTVAYGETSAIVGFTADQVSSSVSGSFSRNGTLMQISGSKSWTFGQAF